MRVYNIFIIGLLCLVSCKDDKPAAEVKSTGNKAMDDLSALIQKTPSDPTLYFDRAELAYKEQSYDEAINDLQYAMELDSLNPAYYHLLSDVYMDYYRSKDGLQVMEKAAEVFPERIPTLLKLSEVQLILQKNHASLLTIAQINTVEPDNPEAYFMTGMNFRALGETKRAINAFRKATEINPELVDAWLITGQLYEEEGDPAAVDYYDAAINVDPKMPTAWHAKAFYLQNQNKENEAIEIYKKINVIDRNYIDAYLNAGILYMTMDSLAQAEEQFTIMSKVQPQNHLSYYYNGLIKQAQNNLSEARSLWETCLNLKPDFVKAKKALGELNAS